jgi:prolipoprotein diacylglyceryl transferase
MGIWGAVALGTLAAYIYIKVKPIGISFPRALDALAPGLLLAQAVGRWGNWFNGELFGRPTKAFWAVQVPPVDRPPGFTQFATFHPTFLYESLWCLCAALFILYFPKVRLLRPGNTFVLYIALYCLGRAGIEAIRIDFAHTIFGLRLNVWVAVIGSVASIVYLVFSERGEKLDSGLGRIAE